MILLFIVAIVWIGASIMVIAMGGKREIGSRTTYIITLLFSPIIALPIVALSKRKQLPYSDYYGDILKLNELRSKGILTDEEFNSNFMNLPQRNNLTIDADRVGIRYYAITLILIVAVVFSAIWFTQSKESQIEKIDPSQHLNSLF